jgi:hypothetical protein
VAARQALARLSALWSLQDLARIDHCHPGARPAPTNWRLIYASFRILKPDAAVRAKLAAQPAKKDISF